MRRAQKQQIEDLVRQIEKAHEQIRTYLEQDSIQPAMAMLEDCQNGGIAIGTAIEETEGEGHPAVSALEEYCELIYQIHTDLAEHKEINANKVYKLLRQKLVKVGNSIRNDIQIRAEAVFLPYKASMWDSLESVWRAADADPDCDVYVVPIPYYDKNPDGRLGEMHYEGNQYPEYVPITHYDTYDLETRRPDVIFIHNPYDENNHVTSVAPRFYAKNLKDYTDKLVYIPYYTLGESMYKIGCVSSGTLLSDVVIAHSAAAKEDYIKYLKAFYATNTEMREKEAEKMLREKILPLGSPKIDKVVNGKREDYVLPEEWKKRLEGRKAVLYNTGVSGILNGNEQELKKIRDTISFFAGRDDVVLWWRPHPLTGATVQSMRYHLMKEYLAIVEEYKKSGIGIYDDTSDLHRALLWTDMYYGDDSSLIYLYGVQGKPIVRQDINCLTELGTGRVGTGIRYKISCQAADSVYFFAAEYNRLYRLKLSNWQTTAIVDVPQELLMEPSLYSQMILWDQTLWLVPSRAHALAAYHLDTEQWEQYDLPDRIKSSTQIQDKIYMLSSDYRHLWIMDLQEKKLERKKIFYRKEERFRLSDDYYNDDLYLIDGKLYYLITHSNMLAVCDLGSRQAELIHIGSEENQYQRLIYDDGCFWLLPNSGGIGVACWDGKNVKESDMSSYPVGFSAPYGLLHAVCRDEDIWLFPYRGNKILCLDKKTMHVTHTLEMSRAMNTEMAHVDIDNVLTLADGRLVISAFVAGAGSRTVVFDPDFQTTVQYNCVCPDEKQIDYSRIFERLETEKYTSAYAYQIIEGRIYTLTRICDALVKMNCVNAEMERYYRSLYANSVGTAGAHIWEEVKP